MNRVLDRNIADRHALQSKVIDSQNIAAGGTITHEGENVEKYSKITALVSTDQDCTVYVQLSDDNTNFYDIKTEADGDLSWNCNNEKIAIPLSDYTAKYLRLVIKNNSGSTATVTAVIMAQV